MPTPAFLTPDPLPRLQERITYELGRLRWAREVLDLAMCEEAERLLNVALDHWWAVWRAQKSLT